MCLVGYCFFFQITARAATAIAVAATAITPTPTPVFTGPISCPPTLCSSADVVV